MDLCDFIIPDRTEFLLECTPSIACFFRLDRYACEAAAACALDNAKCEDKVYTAGTCGDEEKTFNNCVERACEDDANDENSQCVALALLADLESAFGG